MAEQELHELLARYQEKFGKPYLCVPEWQTDEEIAAGIKQCLESGAERPEDSASKDVVY